MVLHRLRAFAAAKTLTDAADAREYIESASHLSMFANALRGSEVMNTFDGVTPYRCSHRATPHLCVFCATRVSGPFRRLV